MCATSWLSTTRTRSSDHRSADDDTSTIGRRWPHVTSSAGRLLTSRRMGRRTPYSRATASAVARHRALSTGLALEANRASRHKPANNTARLLPAPSIHTPDIHFNVVVAMAAREVANGGAADSAAHSKLATAVGDFADRSSG